MTDRKKFASVFRSREEIFPKWFLETEKCLQIIEKSKAYHSKINDEVKCLPRPFPWQQFSEKLLVSDAFDGIDLTELYINTILGYYSDGWPIVLQKKKVRYVWLFFRLNARIFDKDVRKFSQKIIDDIVKCPFEIDWSIPFQLTVEGLSGSWTKKHMCETIANTFAGQVNKKQVEMLFPYVFDTINLNTLTFWMENGLINVNLHSSKIISRVQGVLDNYSKNRPFPYDQIAYLEILGGSRYEQREQSTITELRKIIVSTNKFPELHQKLVTLFDNAVRLYNISSFDHHVYNCKYIFESSYDIPDFQALPFIDGTRMKVVKRWFKWVLE